jgi:hypothetical protein
VNSSGTSIQADGQAIRLAGRRLTPQVDTLLAERLMGDRWENVINVAVNDRDPTLIKALLDRGWPIRKARRSRSA